MSDNGSRNAPDRVSLESVLRGSIEGPAADARERMRARVLADVRGGVLPGVARAAFMRAAATFVALSLGVGGTSLAAANSLPGSPLYPLKRAMEEIRVQLTPPSSRSDALVDLARERVREVRELMDSDASDAAVDTAVEGFDDAAKRAVEHESDPEQARERERELEQAVSSETEPVRERVEEGTGSSSNTDPAGESGGNEGPAPGPGPGDSDSAPKPGPGTDGDDSNAEPGSPSGNQKSTTP